jgi:hypothetical protein
MARFRALVAPVCAAAASRSASTSGCARPTVAEWSRSTCGRSTPPTGFAAMPTLARKPYQLDRPESCRPTVATLSGRPVRGFGVVSSSRAKALT